MTTPAPGTAPAAPTPTNATDVTPSPTSQPASPEAAQPSKEEWVQWRKDTRALNDKLELLIKGQATSPTPPGPSIPTRTEPTAQPADAALAEVRELRRDLAVKDAILTAGVSDPKARRLIELAVKAENPGDIGAFVSDYAAAFAKAAPASATPTPANPAAPPASPGRTDTGAPGTRPDAPLPANPNQIPPAEWKALSAEKRKEHLQSWLADGGQTNWMKGRKKA